MRIWFLLMKDKRLYWFLLLCFVSCAQNKEYAVKKKRRIVQSPECLEGRSPEIWTRYINEDGLAGYKDCAGNVVVEAKYYQGIVRGDFRNIATYHNPDLSVRLDAVYQLKSGKILDVEPYFFENSPDCEQDGYIRFESYEGDSRKEHKVGLLDVRGKIRLDADYTWLSQVHGRFIKSLKDATIKCIHDHCEHYVFEGGMAELISLDDGVRARLETHKKPVFRSIDWNSVSIDTQNKALLPTFEETFLQHLEQVRKEEEKLKLLNPNGSDVYYIKNIPMKLTTTEKKSLLQKVTQAINARATEELASDTSGHKLDIQLFPPEKWRHFYNLCFEMRDDLYHLLKLTGKTANDFGVDSIDFIRTPKGYRFFGFNNKSDYYD